jgi:hypothetical protein
MHPVMEIVPNKALSLSLSLSLSHVYMYDIEKSKGFLENSKKELATRSRESTFET